jgi:hypothetical protein
MPITHKWHFFFGTFKNFYYLCTVNLRRGMSVHHRRRVADIIRRQIRFVLGFTNLVNS